MRAGSFKKKVSKYYKPNKVPVSVKILLKIILIICGEKSWS
jgi:hypothetical protein